MGAVTATIDADAYNPFNASAQGTMIACKLTMSSSYATGGDTFAPAIVGLGVVTKMTLSGSAGGTTDYDFSPVYSSGQVTKIQAFATGSGNQQPFAEVAAATNLSTVVTDAIVWGY